MIYGFLGIGFVLLLAGSEAVRRGGASLFCALGVPPFFVNLLIVSLAMSAPELSVALQANARNMPDVALGVIVGSTIANLLLVLGLGALIRPVPAPPRTVFRDGGMLVVSSAIVVFALLSDFIALPFGAFLLACWFGYLVLVYLTELGRAQQMFDGPPPAGADESRGALGFFLFLIGSIGIFFGARFALDFSVVTAHNLHVSGTAVALTAVAFATSLPEMLRTLVSAVRGHPNPLSGQIIASSLFNLLLVLGLATIVRPLSVPPMIADFDGPFMAGSAILVTLLMLFGWRLTRGQGLVLLIAYVAYIASVMARSGLHLAG